MTQAHKPFRFTPPFLGEFLALVSGGSAVLPLSPDVVRRIEEDALRCDRCGEQGSLDDWRSEFLSTLANGVHLGAGGGRFGPGAAYYCPTCASGVAFCRVCGCSDEEGCAEGCWWVGPDLCSVCAGKIPVVSDGYEAIG